MSRIRIGHPFGQTPPNVFSDFHWVRTHEKELLAKYGEVVIVVYKEQVIGIGDDYDTALADAERNLPDGEEEITPIRTWLYHRQPFFRVYPTSK